MCHWCCYAGADLAGVSRISYPPHIRTIRVMCSARVDPALVLETLSRGADGVLTGGCHIGDCHYATGNHHTEVRFWLLEYLLEAAGINPDRALLVWVSAAEGARFAQVVDEFTNRIRELGPLDSRALGPAVEAAGGFRLRSVVGKVVGLRDEGDVYGQPVEEERLREILKQTAVSELERCRMLAAARKQPATCVEMAEAAGLAPRDALMNIAALRSDGRLEVFSEEDFEVRYRAAPQPEAEA
jgi:coenzyme F420-reducing hydrogenase delta subunit